jgi:transcriptional regulator with XRE-family HTH domain
MVRPRARQDRFVKWTRASCDSGTREQPGFAGTTQPYVAKLESGRIKNLGLKTLVKCATALDARLTVRLVPRHAAPAARATKTPTKTHGLRRALRNAS